MQLPLFIVKMKLVIWSLPGEPCSMIKLVSLINPGKYVKHVVFVIVEKNKFLQQQNS